MKIRHLKLVWGASTVIRGHWYLGLFGVYDRVEGSRGDGLAISVRGLLLWLFAAALAAYLSFTGVVFWFWQRNPYNLLTYSDALLWPARRAQVRDLQGQAFIAQGVEAMRGKRWAEAVSLLRQGLAYHPGDLRGRIALAQFYVAANQRPIALRLLEEGLGPDFPGRPFLQLLFDLAEQGDDFGLTIRTGGRYITPLKSESHPGDRRWLQGRIFAAMIGAERFADALALARSEGAGDTADEHQVLALLGLGRPDEALARLAAWESRPGSDRRAVLRLRARAQREAGRLDAFERSLEQLKAIAPDDPRTAVYGIVQRAMAGRETAAGAALDDFLFRFGGSPDNLQLLADPLSEIGRRALLERVAAAAADRGYAAAPFQVLQVRVALQQADWAAAGRIVAAMKPAAQRDPVGLLWREWIQRLLPAASTASDTAGPALVEFLRSRSWPIKIHRLSVDALRRGGRLETARDVLGLAASAFPASAWVRTQQAEVAAALTARQAAAPVAASAAALPGEKAFFQRLESLLGAAQWPDAEQLLRDARGAKPPPPWFESRDAELRFAQLRIALGQGEVTPLIAAAKLYLNRDPARARQALDAAVAARAKGNQDLAVVLVKEILRAAPDFLPAKRALAEWLPPPAGK